MKRPLSDFWNGYSLIVSLVELLYIIYVYIWNVSWDITIANAIFFYTFWIWGIIILILYFIFKYDKRFK